MATKINWILSLFTICALCSACAGCRPVSIFGCPESLYHFQINAIVTPDKDTVNIGDTIWVKINSPVVFTDQGTDEEVNFSNASNLGTAIGFVKVINRSPIQLADVVPDFEFVLLTGSEVKSPKPDLIKLYLFSEINNRYIFNLGIIPKDTGTYRFDLESPVHVYRKKRPCPKADFYIGIIQTNQHVYLYPGGDSAISAGPDYFFYVK